jgi:uncharacterized protein YndB with AHSA1/START domain
MTIDIIAAAGAVTRAVETRDHEGQPAYVVRASRVYPTDVDDLWDAISNPERIPRWFLPVSGDLRLGGRYQLQGNAGGEITTCEPPRHLAVTWAMGGGAPSWVDVRLSKHKEGALLVLEHTARVADMPPGMWEQFGPGAVGVGWDLAINYGLAQHIASGGAQIDPQVGAAWPTTEEGKMFVKACAEDWARAAVASGQDAAAAAQAAKNTTAFYTGGGDM